MYLLFDATDSTYTVVDSSTNPTISSGWWPSPSTAVQKYFDTCHAVFPWNYYSKTKVIAHFTDVKSYDDFLLLYPEFQI